MSAFHDLFPDPKPILGVIHLPALPGYAGSPGIARIVEKAIVDLAALERAGVDGVLLENDGDRPHRVEAAPETIAVMTRIAREAVGAARRSVIGVEILLNDPKASLAVAAASGALFIRTDYFSDPMERPEHGGRMKIDPVGLLRYRTLLAAERVLILADIQVKYARMLVDRSMAESARTASENGADAIVVTGRITGEPPRRELLLEAQRGAAERPVLVGSGLDAENAGALLSAADGAIVGTSLQSGGAIDPRKAAALMETVRHIRRAPE